MVLVNVFNGSYVLKDPTYHCKLKIEQRIKKKNTVLLLLKE